MKYAAVLLVAVACSGAFASEPGQPLNCSDWVFLVPGLSCVPWIASNCTDEIPPSPVCTPNLANAVFDNEGRQLAVRIFPNGATCCNSTGSCNPCLRWALISYNGASEVVVGYLDSRLDGTGGVDTLSGSPPGIDFDRSTGRLMVWLTGFSTQSLYTATKSAIAIGGFTSLFDVLQAFVPQPATLGFRVPYMPEGMAAADHFDTYWGKLAHPIDFTQAHPMQCGYPAAAPHLGDYLTVADTVPTPAPGQGIYYVTSATYQGATRYGRKTTAGHLTGRDSAVLPGCGP